jgi:ABC-type sugar transport system ATPase subunit
VTRGRILIGGRDVTRLDPDKRRVSMVRQLYALFPTGRWRRTSSSG